MMGAWTSTSSSTISNGVSWRLSWRNLRSFSSPKACGRPPQQRCLPEGLIGCGSNASASLRVALHTSPFGPLTSHGPSHPRNPFPVDIRAASTMLSSPPIQSTSFRYPWSSILTSDPFSILVPRALGAVTVCLSFEEVPDRRRPVRGGRAACPDRAGDGDSRYPEVLPASPPV